MAAVSVGSTTPVLVSTDGSPNDRLTVSFLSSPRSTGTIYYGTTKSVSSANNTGSLAPGGSITLDRQRYYFIAALTANGGAASGLLASYAPVTEEPQVIQGTLVRINGNAIETSTDHGSTWVGAVAGAGSNGPVFQSVDALSATPRSVTDWGTILNTAIAAGTRRFVFGPYDYPFSTAIAANDVRGIHFSGTSAYMGGDGQTGRTSVTWTGTGSGNAIDCTTASPGYGGGFYAEHIIWRYSQTAAFTGYLFSFVNAFFAKFEHCAFSSVNDISGLAHAAIDASNMNTLICSECNFGPGFNVAVRHKSPSLNSGFGNVLRFDECTFQGSAIENPGLDVSLTHCVFELDHYAANQAAIYDTALYVSQPTPQVTLRDCAYWDPGANAATTRIVNAQYNYWTFAAYDCNDHTAGGLAALYSLPSGGSGAISSVNIHGGTTNNHIDVGNAATGFKYSVRVKGVLFASSSNLLNVNTGHGTVEVMGNIGPAGTNVTGLDGFTRVSHERANMTDLATVSIVGTPNLIVFDSFAGDLSGMIVLQNNTGSPSSTGVVAQVALAHAPVFGVGSRSFLAVELTPMVSLVGGSGNATNCYTSQVFAQSALNDLTKWQIGLGTALAAGQAISFAYRVTALETR